MLWVELPEGRDAGALFEPALAQGIRFVPGALCANSGRWRHGLRLGFGSPVGPPVLAALRTLGRLAQALPTQVVAEARADAPADPPAASAPELPGLEG
jgi:DNA-binding transcriptional MocR family regulator